jgi:hypothetical protein
VGFATVDGGLAAYQVETELAAVRAQEDSLKRDVERMRQRAAEMDKLKKLRMRHKWLAYTPAAERYKKVGDNKKAAKVCILCVGPKKLCHACTYMYV